MPASKLKTIPVTCPKCGHVQQEPRGAYSTICKGCRAHFRLEEVEKPAPKKEEKDPIARKKVICFQCSTELEVPVAAESTMCKRCSSHVDLQDYQITATVSKNYRTHGRLVLEEKGYMMNTDSLVGDAVLKGKMIGKIVAKRTLEIYSTAIIKGSFSAAGLIIPAENRFRWPEPLRVERAEIRGELVADLQALGTVVLKSTARMFGNIVAGNLVVENGAVFVGQAKIGPPAPSREEGRPTTAEPSPAKPAIREKRTLSKKSAAV